MADEQLRKAALEYHRFPVPGKIAVTPTKGLINQRDLALAYTPGVAQVCLEIADKPAEATGVSSKEANRARHLVPSRPSSTRCTFSADMGGASFCSLVSASR